ncbi:MAG: hypothetical protein DHS20C18_47140 [Saprospiraceae bacterium]|nr:MAG: hypothetical protein DHS20C18_47140 [Saprospiraceae bacterium]
MEQTKSKPTWLQILEAESWQAELLISGLAIYASLQLPEMLIDLYDWILLHLSEGYLSPLFYTIWYLMIVSSMLIVNFILHFVLRALWIGMVGLVSVYPNGINRDSDMYSVYFMERLIKDFPDVNEFNLSLDRIASQLFAFSFAGAFGMLSFSILLVCFLLITSLIHLLVPAWPEQQIFYVLLFLLIITSISTGMLNSKSIRDKEWVKKIHYPFTIKVVSRLIYTIFYKPINYITYIFFTNNKKKQAITTFILYLVVVMVVAMPTLIRSNSVYHNQDYFFKLDTRFDRSVFYNYEDQLEDNRYILHPIIASEKITGSQLKVFIPISQREEASIDKLCGEFEESEKLDDDENREKERIFELDCLRRYYHFYINDQVLSSKDLLKHVHTNRREKGVLIYLPTSNCKEGLNILKIAFEYYNEKGEKREANIPFWYSREY